MISWISVDNAGFDNRAYNFRVGEPTSASLLNALAGNDRLWRDGKAFALPGEVETATVRAEAGGVFWLWQHIGDGETKTLLNASHYKGITPVSFGSGATGGVIGAKYRVVYVDLWYQTQTTLTDITTFMPGFYTTSATGSDNASNDWKVFAGASPEYPHGKPSVGRGFYAATGSSGGTGNYKLQMTLGTDHTFTFWADSDTDDLKMKYEYEGSADDQYLSFVLKLRVSPVL